MNIDVCLEMVLTDLPYEKRIEETAKAGFNMVEFWFHDVTFGGPAAGTPKDAAAIRQACEANGVGVNNMVVNAPDGSVGGAPVNADDFGCYIDRLHETIEFCKSIGCSKAITCTGNLVPGLTREQMRANLEKAYGLGAELAAANDFTLLLEPLNTHVDHSGYYLDSSSEAAEIVRAIGSPSFKLLFDIYHMQIMEGNIIANIEKSIDIIGHFHSAGVPGRHELMNGELDYRQIVSRIEALGYTGAFGLEYSPLMPDADSLRATKAYLEPGP